MLFPQNNAFRQLLDLSGYWDFCKDGDDRGQAAGWQNGFVGEPIAVPGSWNEQWVDLRDYLGRAWYQTTFHLPQNWSGNDILLRFGSVNYLADVWLNGIFIGKHEGGHLTFEFDVTEHLQAGDNLLVLRVDGELTKDRVPPGQVTNPRDSHKTAIYPLTTFDFFPYCGIHRRVLLWSRPRPALTDLTIQTTLTAVHITTAHTVANITTRHTLRGFGFEKTTTTQTNSAIIDVPQAALWSPEAPNLYNLTTELLQNDTVVDSYTIPVGMRTIEVVGDQLLLNGQPIMLRGFGRHEDFPIAGRGSVPAVNIKDYALLKWIGANSFRTSHYPYDEEALTLADRLGLLVISETAAVGLFFEEEGMERRLELCRQFTHELIERDKNHPSVIMWSLANEARSVRGNELPFFRTLYDDARKLDTTRPITIVSDLFTEEASFDFMDIVCLNLYRGWYQEPGRLTDGFAEFGRILDATHAKFGKPIVVTEFGADAIPGHHALPPEMFSEEYQADFIEGYLAEMAQRPFIVGQHIWNMCDFKTAQGVKRPMAINFKGVFTRDRRPKLAAHRLRQLWSPTTRVDQPPRLVHASLPTEKP